MFTILLMSVKCMRVCVNITCMHRYAVHIFIVRGPLLANYAGKRGKVRGVRYVRRVEAERTSDDGLTA